jgi:tetratricopeptide (TPR) repeat protein
MPLIEGQTAVDRRPVEPLTWKHLHELLSSTAADPDAVLRLAVIALDGMGDHAEAAAHLEVVAEGDPLTTWLSQQVALGHPAAADGWLERLRHGAVATDAWSPLEAQITCRLIDHAAGDWPRPTPVPDGVTGVVGELVLGTLLRRWDHFAVDASSASTLRKLVTAHVLGDRLGRRAEQLQLLRSLEDELPLFVAEVLLELGKSAEDWGEALRLRVAALEPQAGLATELSATVALLWARDPQQPQTLPRLKSGQAAAAWHHLTALLGRMGAESEDRRELARRCLTEAVRAPDACATVLRLRAAELLMSLDLWRDASAAVHSAAQGALGELAQCYRVACAFGDEQWVTAATELIGLSEKAPADEAGFLLRLAALAAMRDRDGSRDVLRALGKKLVELSRDEVMSLGGLLLAAHRRAGDGKAVATLWALLADTLTDPRHVALSAFAAGVANVTAGRNEHALMALQVAQQHAPGDRFVLAGLAIALHSERRWNELFDVLTVLASTSQHDEVADTLLRMALHVAAAETPDPARTLDVIRPLLTRNPDDLEMLRIGAVTFRRMGLYLEAVESLEHAAALTAAPAEAATLLCEVADICRLYLDDPARAIEAYGKALALNPDDELALRGNYELLHAARRLREASAILSRLLALTPSEHRAEMNADQIRLRHELWEKERRVEDVDACIAACAATLQLEPDDETAIDVLLRVCVPMRRWSEVLTIIPSQTRSVAALRGRAQACRELGQWEELVPLLQRLATLIDRAEGLRTALAAGEICESKLDQPAWAEQCYSWTYERFGDVVALSKQADLLRRLGQRERLAVTLERLVEVTPAKGETLRLELARLYAALHDEASARKHYGALLETAPDHVEALREIEPLLQDGEGSHVARARVLEKLLQIGENTAEELSVTLRLGACYAAINDERSLLRVAARLHGRFAQDSTAFRFAEQTYTNLKRYSELCKLYDRRIQLLEAFPASKDEIATLLVRKGIIERDQLGAAAEAAASLSRAVELRPTDTVNLAHLEQVLERTEAWEQLVALYERRATNLRTREESVASLHKAAQIAQQRLKDEATAMRIHEKVLSLDPSNDESFRFLQQKLERRNDFKRLADMLLDRASKGADPVEQIGYILEAAALCEKVGDVQKAVSLYRRINKLDATHRPTLGALARIYETLGNWEELLEVTQQELVLTPDPAKRALLRFKCGSVLETQYHDVEKAEEHYLAAVNTSNSCLPAIHSLRELYARKEQWDRVVTTLEMESKVWREPKERAVVLAQIGEIYATRLANRAQARVYYQSAIREHAECVLAALGLFNGRLESGDYREAAAWGETCGGLMQHAMPQQRAAFYVRWAEVLHRVGRYRHAAEHYVAAIESRGEPHRVLFGLLDLCQVAPDCYDFATTFGELLKAAKKREDTLSIAILNAAYGVLAVQAGDVITALENHTRALELAGDHVRLARPLADLWVLLGQEESALELIGRCRAKAHGEALAEWVDATIWLADFHIAWRQRYDEAVRLCLEVCEEQPNRWEVRQRMAAALLLDGRANEAAAQSARVCEQLAIQGHDPLVLAKQYQALGVAADKAGDVRLAERSWRSAVELDPTSPFPYVALVRQAVARGDWKAAEVQLTRGRAALPPEGCSDLSLAALGLALHQGHEDNATHRDLELLLRGNDEDRIVYCRYHLQTGRAQTTVPILRKIIATRSDYVPALELLAEAWSAMGDYARIRRAQQVVFLALGGKEVPPGGTTPTGTLGESWDRWLRPLTAHPLDGLWRLLAPAIEQRFAVEQPPAASWTDAWMICNHLARFFGHQVEILHTASAEHGVKVYERKIVVPTAMTRLTPEEALPLLAMGLTALRAGYGALYGRPRDQLAIGILLSSLFEEERLWPAPSRELVAKLSRREIRQLGQLVSQRPAVAAEGEALAREWTTVFEDVCVRFSLALTDDIVGLAKAMALGEGLDVDTIVGGGCLGLLPRCASLIPYYLSDDYQTHHEELWRA